MTVDNVVVVLHTDLEEGGGDRVLLVMMARVSLGEGGMPSEGLLRSVGSSGDAGRKKGGTGTNSLESWQN